MIRYVSTLVLILLACTVQAQEVFQVNDLSYSGSEEIHVTPLTSDKNASSYMIWIKTGVKAHFHATHTEYVHILEGEGIMFLGTEEKELKAGDLIAIPSNTVHSVEVTSATPMKVISIQTPEFKGQDRVFVRPYMKKD